MNHYRTIKELVVETYMSEGGFPSYEKRSDEPSITVGLLPRVTEPPAPQPARSRARMELRASGVHAPRAPGQ